MATTAKGVSDSEFNMWRAVFTFALVDNVLSVEEQTLLQSYIHLVPFSTLQLSILRQDFKTPQNVETLYRRITRAADRERFCVLARALVWCEGDMDRQEEKILKRLSCLRGGADNDVLRRSRLHPRLHDYHQHYARAGMVGLIKQAPTLQMQA
jgi:hypothetical protein